MTNPTWIEWAGGECPVAGDKLVDVEHFDGTRSYCERAGSMICEGIGGFDWWKHYDPDWGDEGFIKRYRLSGDDA